MPRSACRDRRRSATRSNLGHPIRVADLLVDESKGREGELFLSQAALATLLGVSRQSVNEALGVLRRQGAVATGYRRISVLDPEALQSVAAGKRS